MHIGEEIRRRRVERGLSLRELGAKAEVSYSYLSKLEGGKVAPPRKDILTRIARAVDTPVEDWQFLVGETGSKGSVDTPNLHVIEVLLQLFQRPKDIAMQDWQHILRIAREGTDDNYRLQDLVKYVEDIPTSDASTLARKERGITTVWSDMPVKFKRGLWNLLYLLLRKNITYHIENAHILGELLASGRRVLLVAKHRDIATFIGYLVETKPDIAGLNKIVMMMSESVDGQEAARYMAMAQVEVQCIMRPARNTTASERRVRHKAYWNFLHLCNHAGSGAVAATALDTRKGRRGRELSQGPILVAKRCGAVIIPVVARNKIEVILEKSWDKQRIPLRTGVICIGEPFEVNTGHGSKWREQETQRLDERLEELDRAVGNRIKPLQIKLGS
jgi:transcriptional regulator with XRE-family HTH domain/lysophospholipid acyltransferase (LPLAT)-like uncharacterized protein